MLVQKKVICDMSVQKSPAQREPEKSSKVEKLRKEFEKILTTWEKVKVEKKF